MYTSKICHLFRVLMNDGVCECACTTLVLVCTGVVPSYAETRKKAGPISFNLLIHGLIHGIWLYGSQREEIFSPTARKFLSIVCNMRDLLSVVRILLPGKPGNVLHNVLLLFYGSLLGLSEHEYLRSKCAGVIV